MPRTGQPAVRHVAAVERALAVLDALSDGAPELGTNEIARRTGINASTVSRLLATLAGAGEREPHLNAIAAPVFGASGELAAIVGVQGPSSRFGRDAMRSALQRLVERAQAVSEALGWDDADR